MVQAAFLLEKMLLEYSEAAKMAFGREVCQAKLHYSPASIGWPVWALDPSKARLGPGPFKGSIPKHCCINRGAFMLLGPAGPWALQGPIPKQRPEASGARIFQKVVAWGVWNPAQGFHLEWNPKP